MSNLEDLSRHRTFSPPAGGADAARVRGLRRRSRRQALQAGSALGVVSLVAAVVVVQTGTPAGRDSLTPLERQGAEPAPAVSASPLESGPGTSASEVPARPVGPRKQAEQRQRQSSPLPLLPGRASASASARPAQPAPTGGPYAAVTRSYVGGGAPEGCSTSTPKVTVAGRVVNPPCSSASVTGTGRSRTLGVDFCVAAEDTAPVTLRFASDREVAWAVSDGSDDVWTWGRGGSPTGAAHDVLVRPGDCLTWRTAWAGVGDNGVALEEGRYTLRTQLEAADGPYRYQRNFEL